MIQLLLSLVAFLAFLLSWININHLSPWPGFYSESFAVFSLCALLLAYFLKGEKIKLNVCGGIFIVLCCVHVVFQYASKRIIFFSTSVLYIYYFSFVALTFSLGQFIKKQGKEILVVSALFFVTLISAFLALAEWLGLGNTGIFIWLIDSQRFSFKALGNIMQPNHLGTLCVMGIAATIILWSHKEWHWVTALPSVILMSSVAGLTASRSTMLNMLLLAILACFFVNNNNRKKTFIIVLSSLLVLVCILFYAQSFYDSLLLGDSSGISIINRGVDGAGRGAFWMQAIAAIKLQPWFGFGWRQVHASQILTAPVYPGNYATVYYHNFFLDFLVENGIVFFVLYALIFVVWLKNGRLGDHKDYMLVALMLCIPSLTEFQFSYTYILFPAVLFFSIAWDKKCDSSVYLINSRRFNLFNLLFLISFFLVSCLIFFDYLKCEKLFLSYRLRENRILVDDRSLQDPKIFVLDDLALLSSVFLFDKDVYSKDDLKKLNYLSARYPYIVIKYYFIKALIQFGELKRAQEVYKGVMNCYGSNAKKYLNSMLDEQSLLWVIREGV